MHLDGIGIGIGKWEREWEWGLLSYETSCRRLILHVAICSAPVSIPRGQHASEIRLHANQTMVDWLLYVFSRCCLEFSEAF